MSAERNDAVSPVQSVPLPWHRADWELLRELRENARLPHALLITGARATGAERFALALSRVLLCAHPAAGINCGQCHACELSAVGSHGDVRWVQPVDKSRVIKIEQVRAAIAFSQTTASFGKNKVLVLAPAESMTASAGNALLKCLEEPVADTYFLLVCTSLHGVPATIRSRCRRLNLASPDAPRALEWLHEQTGDRALSERLLALADGNPLQAEALQREGLAEQFARSRESLRGVLSGELSVAQACAALAEEDVSAFLTLYSAELRRCIRDQAREDRLAGTAERLFELLDSALQMQRAVAAGANPGHRLLLDLFLSKSHRALGG